MRDVVMSDALKRVVWDAERATEAWRALPHWCLVVLAELAHGTFRDVDSDIALEETCAEDWDVRDVEASPMSLRRDQWLGRQ